MFKLTSLWPNTQIGMIPRVQIEAAFSGIVRANLTRRTERKKKPGGDECEMEGSYP